MSSLVRAIENTLRGWNEPDAPAAAILPAEHELARLISSAVVEGRDRITVTRPDGSEYAAYAIPADEVAP